MDLIKLPKIELQCHLDGSVRAEIIGHGVYIKDCEDAYSIVKNKKVILEICPTSNVQTKAVDSFANHPIYGFHKDGIKVTINSDNRAVSDTTLSNEYSIVLNELDITYYEYKQLYYNSVDASFADSQTKTTLRKYIK
ncbi:amidohydrolase family protein [Tepidibacter aestuarii]|uniref:hypothetical protein n=1 Tax=Tepidibacter aestuarii TaxID=2925782 RepID=UPI0020BE7A39|nr:hypothetical protein [Tepidibacter aestuarii]CAH2213034.1 protein of unknown function [Tepidibacter aestuarii]